MIHLKKIITQVLLCFLASSCANSQNNIKNTIEETEILKDDFTGRIEYVDNFLNFVLSYDSCGSLLSSQKWAFNNGFIIIETFDPMDSVISKTNPIKFIRKDSLIYILSIASNNQIDTIKQFMLSKSDTIESMDDFRITKNEKEINTESIYQGDTILTIGDVMYDCYRFESFKYWMKTFPGPSHSKKITYIDKKTLIPIQEDYLSFFMKHFCLTTKEWIMTRQVKLHKIYKK